jgi:hypothetical protein
MADTAIYFRQQAARCQRLAWCCSDEKTAESLRLMGEDYLLQAQQLERGQNDNVIEVKPIQT